MSKQLSLFGGSTIEASATLPENHMEIARNRERLIKKFQEAPGGQGKTETIRNFLNQYFSGLLPGVYGLGHVSRSTFYAWLRDYREGGLDALVPHYSDHLPKISKAEMRLLKELLAENIPSGKMIFLIKYLLNKRGSSTPSSIATLRRWVDRMRKGKKCS